MFVTVFRNENIYASAHFADLTLVNNCRFSTASYFLPLWVAFESMMYSQGQGFLIFVDRGPFKVLWVVACVRNLQKLVTGRSSHQAQLSLGYIPCLK